jgi:hypothetical protein
VTFKFSRKRGEWKAFGKALDPKTFDRAVRRHVRRATALNGKVLLRGIRKTIQSGNFESNKPLTVAIKGSSKPLVDYGHHLFQALTSKVVDDFTAFAGVLQKDDFYNIARFLHDGGALPVTDKMRGLFYVLWLASRNAIDPGELTGRAAELWDRMPGGWFPLDENTQAIMIAGRPFIEKAIEDPEFRKLAKRNWEAALNAAFRDLSASGRSGG